MSKVVIQGNANGTGNFTIAAPNSNTDRTFNLPDAAGTVLTSASNADFPSGSVINVEISEITVSSTRATATSFADDIVFANYTPVRTTSTIYIIGNASMSSYGANYLYLKWVVNGSDYLSTGSTPICTYLDYSGAGGNNEHKGYPIHTKIDNTTGADITCKVQGRVSTSTLYINRAANPSTSGAPASIMYIEVA